MMRRSLAPAAAALALVLLFVAGCDVVDPDPEGIIVEHEERFRFQTTAAELAEGVEIQAQAPLDVSATLQSRGFAKGDVISAEVVSAELTRVTPLSLSLNEILTGASVQLSAATSATVAQASSIGSGSSTAMQVSGGEIAAIVRAPSAAAVLHATPVDGLPSGSYVFQVRMQIRMTVEGL